MSSRNAYLITVNDTNSWKYDELKRRLDDVFNGHIEERDHAIFAQDSPGVDSSFGRADPGNISPGLIESQIHGPICDDWSDVNEIVEAHDLEYDNPDSFGSLEEIIDQIEHRYSNDTAGVSETNLL